MSIPSVSHSDLVKSVLNAATHQFGKDFSVALRDALNAVGTHPEAISIRQEIASHLPELTSASGAGYLAIWLGASVEGGLAPEPTIPPVLNTLMKWCALFRTPAEQVEAAEKKEVTASETEKEILLGIDLLGQALVAHLTASPPQRLQIAGNIKVITELERVEPYTSGPVWVLEILRMRSGSLIVIDVQQQQGARVTYENLSNCFHLFTLLQQALKNGIQRNTPGIQPHQIDLNQQTTHQYPNEDTARWHFGRGDVPRADFVGSVWGEHGPDSIPQIDGQQVLLLWPKILGARVWDSSFFGPKLMASPPNVTVVEQLTREQIKGWWKRLGLPVLPQKPWWKFW